MWRPRPREELIGLVEQILSGLGTADEEQLDGWIRAFAAGVPHPRASGLIFYSHEFWDAEPTAEQIVDRALSYEPFAP